MPEKYSSGGGRIFDKLANGTAWLAGQPASFLISVSLIAIWVTTGPIFRYSDTWQLVVNTGTTVVTFLMVFLIQHTQNRDALAVQVKLDELVRALEPANNQMVGIEKLPEAEVKSLEEKVLKDASGADSNAAKHAYDDRSCRRDKRS